MNYDQYFKICRDIASKNTNSLSSFYDDPVKKVPVESFSNTYLSSVENISERVKVYFDNNPVNDIMNWYPNFWDFSEQICAMCDELVPWLEDNTFGCYLYVDKIYLYRTAKLQSRESSYIWHYDNNPQEVVKNIIYLNEVTYENSPFEYLQNPEGRGVLCEATRKGTDHWLPAVNNSRIDREVKALMLQGFNSKKVTGPLGTTYSFNNNAAHRVNPILEGYRDVINIRVRPTANKPHEYLSKKWTTDNKVPGVVDPDPEKDWKYYE